MKFAEELLEQMPYSKKNFNIGEMGTVLRKIVEQRSLEIYYNSEELQKALREEKIPESTIYQLCLMIQVSGFEQLTQLDSPTKQIELDRYVHNAVVETGLSKDVIMELTAYIAYSLDIAIFCGTEEKINSALESKSAYVIPYSMYKRELNDFRRLMIDEKAQKFLPFEILEPLVATGLPKAKFYMGYCLLKGVSLEEDSKRGLQLLKEAAQAGDIEASAALGDYYYEQNDVDSLELAYQYYTDYGALALNKKRQNAMISILNNKKYNQKMMKLSVAFAAFAIIVILLLSQLSLYAIHPVWSGICIIIEGLLAGLAIYIHKNRPYYSLYQMPVVMFVVWCFFAAIKLIF